MKELFKQYFPLWNKLNNKHQEMLVNNATFMSVVKGKILHNGDADCIGVILVYVGQLRAYLMSDEGKEVSLFRLFQGNLCLLSAACMMASIQFEIIVEAEKETTVWIIPAEIYKQIMEESVIVANYTNEIMAARFSDVMWLIEQIIFKNMDERLARFLFTESSLEKTDTLKITHEQIAHHLGSAREVITRLLKYLQTEGIVKLNRGGITILDKKLLSDKIRL